MAEIGHPVAAAELSKRVPEMATRLTCGQGTFGVSTRLREKPYAADRQGMRNHMSRVRSQM